MRTRTSLVACWLLSACSSEPQYIGDGKLYQLALTNDTTPALQTQGGALFIVETHAWLPVRTPNAEERSALNVQGDRAQPFPRLPWVARDDIPIQVDFTLTNLDDKKHNIDVILNGANEFWEYWPGIVMDEEDAIPLHSQWEKRYDLGPQQRVAESVREEELDEMAVDLATVVNGAPKPSFWSSSGLVESTFLTIVSSFSCALPEPAPPLVEPMVTLFSAPHSKDLTLMVPCVPFVVVSPVMPSIFRK